MIKVKICSFEYVGYLGLLMLLQAYLLAIFKLGFSSIRNEDKIPPFVRKSYNLASLINHLFYRFMLRDMNRLLKDYIFCNQFYLFRLQ